MKMDQEPTDPDIEDLLDRISTLLRNQQIIASHVKVLLHQKTTMKGLLFGIGSDEFSLMPLGWCLVMSSLL